MVNYKQIATINGPAATAIQKAIDEERILTFKYMKEGKERATIILGAEIKGNESVDREEELMKKENCYLHLND